MRSLLALAFCFALVAQVSLAQDIDNCKTYNPDRSQCTECEDGFGVDGFHKCTPCSEGCDKCGLSVQKCTACKDTFFLEADKCTACGTACATCANKDTCSSCKDENCGTCAPTTCTTCKDHFFKGGDGLCAECGENCNKCTSPTECTECASKFFVKEGLCAECGENCQECTSATECTKCVDDWFVKAGTCVACDPNCETCGVTGCTTCKQSFYPDVDSGLCDKCSDAIAHCSVCTDSTTCTACEGAFFLDENKCNACGKACGTCEVADKCLTCKDKNCQNCLVDANTCTECATGYYSNGEGDCVLCGDGCEECAAAETCDKCELGFFHLTDHSVCVKCDDKCETCNEHGCAKCAEAFFPDTKGLCSACGASCKQCTSATACEVCLDNFFPNKEGTCIAQDPNCEKKGDHGCEQCKAGFYADKDTGLCPGCPSGCAKCNAAKTCDECASSFKSANGDGECTTKAWVIIMSVVFGIALLGGLWKGYSVYSKKRASALNHELLRNTNDSR